MPALASQALLPTASMALLSGVPMVVLDTNVVLDWLVFHDRHCKSLDAWLGDGRMRWIASARMRDELAHVMARGGLARWQPVERDIWAVWGARCQATESGDLHEAATRLRCGDPDDQKFFDLALSRGARWLLSHDRAVLRLARRARPLGLQVLTPAAWAAEVA